MKRALNAGNLTRLSDVANLAPGGATTLALSQIRIEKQVRRTFEGLDELAESIKAQGVIEPVIVHQESDGSYRLVVGERRCRAAKMAGLDVVPVVIKRGLDDKALRSIQIAENNERENLTAYEEAEGVVEDVQKYGFDAACAIWNRSKGWISKRSKSSSYLPATRDALKSGISNDFEWLGSLQQLEELDARAAASVVALAGKGEAPSRNQLRDQVAGMKAAKEASVAGSKKSEELPAKKAPENHPPVNAELLDVVSGLLQPAFEQYGDAEVRRALKALIDGSR